MLCLRMMTGTGGLGFYITELNIVMLLCLAWTAVLSTLGLPQSLICLMQQKLILEVLRPQRRENEFRKTPDSNACIKRPPFSNNGGGHSMEEKVGP